MESVRCIIADMPHNLLADIIQKITDSRPDIEVVGRVDQNTNLSELLEEQEADVVMLNMDDINLSEQLSRVFKMQPQVIAVGVVSDAKRICVCVDDMGPDDFMSLVKAAASRKHNF